PRKIGAAFDEEQVIATKKPENDIDCSDHTGHNH
ncbi:MAG: hypothetical protein H6R01_2053, partial [Burkholderiaceae bacterium]|nr:hypothetical protein [Burkholderiaceae bacterium]